MENTGGFAPVRRQRLSDELVQRILRAIDSGELRSGDRLPSIVVMAQRFGVATTTVREALMQLEGRRAVAIRQGSGVYVT